MDNQIIKEYWNNCGLSYAHLTDDKRPLKNTILASAYDNCIFKYINFTNKTVLDYGIGAGFIGEYLFEKFEIKKYIGLDISERSIRIAKKLLKPYNAIIHKAPKKFIKYKADIFLSIACIQHFPDQQYLDKFLDNLNKSKIPVLVLQIRYNEETEFNNAYDSEDGNKGLACRTNTDYILSKLTNYKLYKITLHNIGSNYQYIIYKINEL